MSKFSKLLKLLSASAIVAGSNSFALADCGICGEQSHERNACPHFDYKGFGASIGFHRQTISDGDKNYLGTLATTNKEQSAKFLNAPGSGGISSESVTVRTSQGGQKQYTNTLLPSETVPVADTETSALSTNQIDEVRDATAKKIQNARRSQLARRKAKRFLAQAKEDRKELNDRVAKAVRIHKDDEIYEHEQRVRRLRDEIREREAKKAYEAEQREAGRREDAVRKIQVARRAQLARRAQTVSETPASSLSASVPASQIENVEQSASLSNNSAPTANSFVETRTKTSVPDRSVQSLEESSERSQGNQKLYTNAPTPSMTSSTPEGNSSAPGNWLESDEDLGLQELFNEGNIRQASAPMPVSGTKTSQASQKLYTNTLLPSESAVTPETTVSQRGQKLYTNTPLPSEDVSSPQAEEQWDREAEKVQIARIKERNADLGLGTLFDEERAQKELAERRGKAAVKLQNAFRARKARKEAEWRKYLKENLEDPEVEARTLAEADRENESYRRQAQIESDYQLAKTLQEEEDHLGAKMLQAEYDAEDAQIRADRALAEKIRAKQIQEQVESDGRLARDLQKEFDEENNRLEAERQHLEAEGYSNVVAAEEPETERWDIPLGLRRACRNNNIDAWGDKLESLRVRQLESMLWLVSTAYQQRLEDGARPEDNRTADVVKEVALNLFPAHGAEPTKEVKNVYRAFELARGTGDSERANFESFIRELDRLTMRELDKALLCIAERYAHLLLNGSTPASNSLVALSKAIFEVFGRRWEVDVAAEKIEDDNKVPALEPAVPNRIANNVVREDEAPESEEWDLPFHRFGEDRDINEDLYYTAARDLTPKLKKMGVRRLEAIMDFASPLYSKRKDVTYKSLVKCAGDIKALGMLDKEEQNARLQNCFLAVQHLQESSKENFKRLFEDMETRKIEIILGEIASVYREKLRSGSRPADMAFVSFANEICKALNLDGFFNGEDDEPLPNFEEFGGQAEPAKGTVVNNANGMKPAEVPVEKRVSPEAPDTTSWQLPDGVRQAFGYFELGYQQEGNTIEIETALNGLTVRQLEATIAMVSSVYALRANHEYWGRFESPINEKMLNAAINFCKFIASAPAGDDGKLSNVRNALNSVTNAEAFKEDLEHITLRKMEAFFSMIFKAYDKKLSKGAVPVDDALVRVTDKVLTLFSIPSEREINEDKEDDKDWLPITNEEEPENHLQNALGEDDRALIPVGA